MGEIQKNSSAAVDALAGALAQSYEELSLLHRISQRMPLTQSPESFFGDLARDLREVLEVERLLVLWRLRPRLEDPIEQAGDTQPALGSRELECLWQRALDRAEEGQILLENKIDTDPSQPWPESFRNLAAVPIHRPEQVLGFIVGLNKAEGLHFTPADIKLLTSVAAQGSIFLENFRLYQDLHELLLGSLRALTSTIDAKDPYTSGHSDRVGLLSRFIAQRLAFSPDEVNTAYLAGLLHDIGKIGIREAVLCKPGRLSPDEFEQIRQHPRIGSTILSGIPQMNAIIPGVLSHHERFGGGGYPQNLSGRDIPLLGRIVMLADSLDAMISDRTYRKAMPLESALAEVRRFSGTQFDPDIAESLLRVDREELVEELGLGEEELESCRAG